VPAGEADSGFLDVTEVEALWRALPADHLASDRACAVSHRGDERLRQGELLALRWRDVNGRGGA